MEQEEQQKAMSQMPLIQNEVGDEMGYKMKDEIGDETA
jgi:hypothetical protein